MWPPETIRISAGKISAADRAFAGVEPVAVDVAFEMVDGDEREAGGEGKPLGEIDADEEAAGQARPLRDGDGVELAHVGHGGIGEGLLDDCLYGEHVLTAGNLGVDAAETAVKVDLAGNAVAEDMASVGDDRGGGLVAAGLDGEDAARGRGGCALRGSSVALCPAGETASSFGAVRAAQIRTSRPRMPSPIRATSL